MNPDQQLSILEVAQQALKQAKALAKAQASPITPNAPSEAPEACQEAPEDQACPGEQESREVIGTVESYRPPLQPLVYLDQPSPPTTSHFQSAKFGCIPDQIRESDQINTFEVKKFNLAAAIESLEQALASHMAMPAPDAAFAVAGLSELIMKLTRDLERSQDPKKLYDQIVSDIFQKMTEHMVFTVGSEMKWLIGETQKLVTQEKQNQMTETIKNATRRVAPALNEVLDIAQSRLLKILNLKEKDR